MKTFATMVSSIVFPEKFKSIVTMTTGKAFLGIFMLTIVFGSISYFVVSNKFKAIVIELEQKYATEMPEFEYTVDKGLVVHTQMPIIHKSSDSIFIIDTRDATDQVISDKYVPMIREYPKGIIIGNRTIINKQNAMKTETYDLNQMNPLAPFDKNDVAKFFQYWWVAALIGLPFYLIFFFCAKMISMFIVSLVALIVNASSKYGFSYGKLLIASVFALTAPVIMDIVLSIFKIDHIMFFFIFYAIAAIYIILGLRKASSQS